MVNINDFKLLCQKNKKYFDLLTTELNVDLHSCTTKVKERIGFYIFMLESICGIKDISDIAEMVTDTDFNSLISGNKFEDYGIDAIEINEDNHTINLFNFKYREKFDTNKEQSINETIISLKFVNALVTGKFDNLKGKIKEKAEKIFNCLTESKDIWKLKLYVVSNECILLDPSNDNLVNLKNLSQP